MVLDRSYESESSPPTKLDKNCENVKCYLPIRCCTGNTVQYEPRRDREVCLNGNPF